jgi:hypothetical protein
MKQINQASTVSVRSTKNGSSKLLNLGLVEVLVYFCYKFCLIVSRVVVLALFWYLFREWLGLAVCLHVALLYTTALLTINMNENFLQQQKVPKEQQQTVVSSGSRLKQHLVLFITCVLGCVDLFMNQLSEVFYMKKIVGYYVVYFVQNMAVMTYWLTRTVVESRQAVLTERQQVLEEDEESGSGNKFILYSGGKGLAFSEYLTPVTCYAGLIYVCVVMFTVFGLVLKFLHLHILRKRYRRVYN